MINKLKRKFLIMGTVFMFILMTVLVLAMNLINFSQVTADADTVLEVLSQQGLKFSEDMPRPEMPDKPDDFIKKGMSPEIPYESRYFVVRVDSDGEIIKSDLSKIVAVDEDSAQEYIKNALASRNDRGFINNFRYKKTTAGGETSIIFLDCGRKLDDFTNFLIISVIVGLAGCVIVFVAFFFTAGKIVSPIAQSYEKQKRFISDAGHELKTPLTIINANVDLLETEGEKEELQDIRRQIKRLTQLTDNLVFLSKTEESGNVLQKIDFPLSDLVSETAAEFRALALSNSIEFNTDIAQNVTLCGSPDFVRRLISILLENAVKYSPPQGEILLELKTDKKFAMLKISNTTATAVNGEDLKNIFERFFRLDSSRNSQTGGHGIGLSIAKAIVEAHGGSIAASTKTGNDFTITVNLPID